MSTISGTGSASAAWSDVAASRKSQMADRMFSRVDTDGSGGVDKTELQGMLDHIAQKSGASAGSADDLFGKMDSNGDGTLDKDELATGMKSLMPKPSSTMDFAQQRTEGSASESGGNDMFQKLDTNGDGSLSQDEFNAGQHAKAQGGAHGCASPSNGGSADQSAASSSDSSTDPLDTNGDGVVSAQERMVGELKDLMKLADSDSNGELSATEASSFSDQLSKAFDGVIQSMQGASSSSSNGQAATSSGGGSGFSLAAFADKVMKSYAQSTSLLAQQSLSPSLSVSA